MCARGRGLAAQEGESHFLHVGEYGGVCQKGTEIDTFLTYSDLDAGVVCNILWLVDRENQFGKGHNLFKMKRCVL